jgi:hypothetical protein
MQGCSEGKGLAVVGAKLHKTVGLAVVSVEQRHHAAKGAPSSDRAGLFRATITVV